MDLAPARGWAQRSASLSFSFMQGVTTVIGAMEVRHPPPAQTYFGHPALTCPTTIPELRSWASHPLHPHLPGPQNARYLSLSTSLISTSRSNVF